LGFPNQTRVGFPKKTEQEPEQSGLYNLSK
jgi:hypothetical protein